MGGDSLTIVMQVKVEDPGGGPRLILDDYHWPGQDPGFCVHGIKLRWTCDYCAEFFEERASEDGPADQG